MAITFTADVNALVLGEIQVDSALGRPLSARIAFVELTDSDAFQFKARLADAADYKKLGLQYPDNHKFYFQLVNEAGKPPFIRVSTARSVDDPFVNLLIEVSSSSGKLIKSYTFLLDPPSNLPMVSDENALPQHAPTELKSSAVSMPSVSSSVVKSAAVKTARVRKKHQHSVKAAHRWTDDHRQMKLSMSLSISRYDPLAQVATNSDAMQEELISKEKLLNDLKVQIGEMQLVIQDLKGKRADHAIDEMPASGISAVSGVTAASGVSAAASAVSGVSVPVATVALKPKAAPVVHPESAEFNWQKPVATLAGLLAVMSVMFWYRSYMKRPVHGMFDDLHDDAAVGATSAKQDQPGAADTAPADEQSVGALAKKHSVYDALKFDKSGMSSAARANSETKGAVPPEYTVLMEANKYLRAGNDDLAEGALIRAIEINPGNAYGYLALLKIYEKRGDKQGFERMAKQLRKTGDEASFKEAAAMGYRLDSGNPLYATGKSG